MCSSDLDAREMQTLGDCEGVMKISEIMAFTACRAAYRQASLEIKASQPERRRNVTNTNRGKMGLKRRRDKAESLVTLKSASLLHTIS